MKKITLLLSSTVLSICAFAQGSYTYTFDSVKTTSGMIDPSPLPTVTGLSFGSFSAIGTPLNSLAAARFDFADWAIGSLGGPGDSIYSGMTGSVNTAEYYQVTLTPTAGYALTVDSIQFSFERSGTGVRTYAVRSNLDGYTANLNAIYGVPAINVIVQPGNIFWLKKDITTPQNRNIIYLTGMGFGGLTAPVTFRFYGWNAEAASGTFSIDNAKFSGSTTLLTTGVNDYKKSTVTVYPNPSNGLCFADLDDLTGKITITVSDIIGNVILTKETTSNARQSIDLSKLENGNYFIRFITDTQVITKKITLSK